MIFTAAFWKGAGERAIKTFAQSLIAALGVGVGVLDVDWLGALSIAAVATLLSVLTAVGNADFTAGTAPTDEDAFTDAEAEAAEDHEQTHRADI